MNKEQQSQIFDIDSGAYYLTLFLECGISPTQSQIPANTYMFFLLKNTNGWMDFQCLNASKLHQKYLYQ